MAPSQAARAAPLPPRPRQNDVTLGYSLGGGTAAYGTDYTAPGGQSGVITIPRSRSPGPLRIAGIPVTIPNNDGVMSPGANKTFNAFLSVITGAALGPAASAIVKILKGELPVGGAQDAAAGRFYLLWIGSWVAARVPGPV